MTGSSDRVARSQRSRYQGGDGRSKKSRSIGDFSTIQSRRRGLPNRRPRTGTGEIPVEFGAGLGQGQIKRRVASFPFGHPTLDILIPFRKTVFQQPLVAIQFATVVDKDAVAWRVINQETAVEVLVENRRPVR